MEIWQVVKRAGRPDRGQISGVETEEIYAGLAAVGHVGADVELGEAGKARQRRESAGANSAHVEGKNADPTSFVESVERELRWNHGTHYRSGQWPVGEEQILPGLLHHPLAGG